MTHKLRFHSAIPDDIFDALAYYDKISRTLGNRFRETVNQKLDHIASNPEIFPLDVPPVRFAKTDRFPYLIFFVVKSNFVLILAIVHGSSDPKKWRTRD